MKIGFTEADPRRRIVNISTAHWAKMELVSFFDGDRKAEKSLHRRFAAARIRGEWFDVTPEIEEFLKSCPAPPPRKTNKFADRGDKYLAKVRAIWFDKSIVSDNAAGKKAGVHYHVLKRHFGPSGRDTDGRQAQQQAAIDTAKKRTDDGRCKVERLFELWGSGLSIADVVKQSRWPRSSIFRHFAILGITRAMARLEMENRRKAKRASRKK